MIVVLTVKSHSLGSDSGGDVLRLDAVIVDPNGHLVPVTFRIEQHHSRREPIQEKSLGGGQVDDLNNGSGLEHFDCGVEKRRFSANNLLQVVDTESTRLDRKHIEQVENGVRIHFTKIRWIICCV